jgi:hypothetical protein
VAAISRTHNRSPQQNQKAASTDGRLALSLMREFSRQAHDDVPSTRANSYEKLSQLSRFLLCPVNVAVSRFVGPASPTASPESEFLSHGCVASRGVCKGAPHKF